MDKPQHIFDQVTNRISDTIQILREKFPGGLPSFIGLMMSAVVAVKFVSTSIDKNKTKKKIKERQLLAKASIAEIRKRIQACKESINSSITEIPFTELQAKLQQGQLSCQEVLMAYQAKALEVHGRTNCAIGFIFEAEDRACKLDALKPEQRGSLHGIPISLKETVGVAGEDCTAGMSHFIGKIHDDYGVLVKVLIKQGAIPFVRTNISQGLVSMSCENPIFGESCHPLKPERTCGGSSGGEGALLGGKGSILGIACDMGGSTRIPSHFCGVCGVRPTSDRMSDAGNLPFGHGIVTRASPFHENLVREVYGPMGRDVASVVAFFKAALVPEMFRLDPLIPQIPWRNEVFDNRRPMKIGYYVCDGGLEPIPAVHRAVLKAKTCLEKMGHKVVDFAPFDVLYAVGEFGIGALMCDDGQLFGNVLKHDIIDRSIAVTTKLTAIPHGVRKLLSRIFTFLHPVEKSLLAVKSCGDVYGWWMKNEQREEYRRKFIFKMKELGIEAILCPAFPVPPWPLKDDAHSMACGTYTIFFNAINFPSGVLPVTQITEEDINNMVTYPKRNKAEEYVHKICKGTENLPVCVQLVSLPFQEEVVLRLMKDVETALQRL